MKIVCTGVEGMLGAALRRTFADMDFCGFDRGDFDVADLDETVRNLRAADPDFLIHAAAFTDVDGCESHKDEAVRINGLGTRNVAIACEEIGCPMVYISTDYVFDGMKGSAYDEWDKVNPMNVYGLSKLLGEDFVRHLTTKHYIVRTSWLFGQNGKNFVSTILKLLSERDRLEVVNDQRGCPTYTVDLALIIRKLIGKGYGVYHATNTGACTWFDFAAEIAAQSGLRKEIAPVTSEAFKRPAARPAFSVLGNTMLRLEGIPEARHWREALADYLSSTV